MTKITASENAGSAADVRSDRNGMRNNEATTAPGTRPTKITASHARATVALSSTALGGCA
jgi:hypothetical protein